jgi:NAD(P)-dependent dehydrogenase (short-subunit alcohol dehydrogenase family)
MKIDLSGKLALVTGGASGIGLATVQALQQCGAEVAVYDRAAGQDVTDPSQLRAWFQQHAHASIVIANAGTGKPMPMQQTTPEEWHRVIGVNLTGCFHTIQCAAEILRPQSKGSIVLTASTNSFDGEADLIAYNASKAGVLGLLRTAANELGPFGIRVNAVCPGLIRTPLTQFAFTQPDVLKDYFRHIPLGRGGEASEVAAAIAFLASDLASFIHGTPLVIDGGQTATKFGVWNEETARFENDRWLLR